MTKEIKPSLLIVYDYFYPGYKAGGPIQSLANLIITLQSCYNISVLTSAYDLHSDTCYENIKINSWNNITLYGSVLPVSVWYAEKKNPGKKQIKEVLQQIKPDIIYLNGMFSYRFFMLPLMVLNKLSNPSKIVICPRGMLQQGALDGRQFKKKIYLTALKISPLLKKVQWHATNYEEMEDIKKVFGQHQKVSLASNIPKKPVVTIKFPQKEKGRLKLAYLSLIAEKKNLLLLLEIIKNSNDITLDIYGPVKDKDFWETCKSLIDQMPGKASYKGEVKPLKVQEAFTKYDASVLLTKGENFGHALYESLSVGRPVITSNYTPWNNLQQQKAGWNIDISTINDGVSLLYNLYNMPSNVFNEYCTGAHKLAMKYYSQLNSVEEYTQLFSVETKPDFKRVNL